MNYYKEFGEDRFSAWLKQGNRLVIRLDWEAAHDLKDTTGVGIDAVMLDFQGMKVKVDGRWSPPLAGNTDIVVETEL